MRKVLLRLSLLALLLQVLPVTAQVANMPFTQSLDTLQFISGTQVDNQNADDVFYANIPIGFPFSYAGTVTNKIGICTNGFIVMDSLPHSSMWSMNANSNRYVAALCADLMNNNAGGSLEYATVGTAPNRICVVQWKDYGIFGLMYCHLNVQIRLHENSNCIQIVYGYNALSGNSGRVFQVGLTGNTTADYQMRSTASSWISSIPSATYPGSGMFLNPLAFLPNGLVYSFGTCPPTGTPFSYITGNVYTDVNNNGQRDAGENGKPGVMVHDNTQNYFSVSDSNGNYAIAFIDSNTTYSIHSIPPMYWTVSSTPVTHTVQPISQAANNRDFGLHPTPNVHDVVITAASAPAPFPNANVTMMASYHNNGTVVEPGDSIFLLKDNHYAYVSANPAPAYVSGDSLVWTYTNLLIGEYRSISVQLHADTTIQAGDTLHSFWTIKPLATDAAPTDNHVALHQLCFASFDPNDKAVTPDGDIPASTPVLSYLIRFQNTGNAPAQNVFINDTLHSNLDVSTFELLGYSHPMNWTITGNGNLRFTFPGINLPDSVSNEPASHGFIAYRIKPKSGLTVGQTITNTAHIIFDYNAPVVTNTTLNTIVESTPAGLQGQWNELPLTVYPNPTEGTLMAVAPNNFQQPVAELRDMQGRSLPLSVQVYGKRLSMDPGKLAPGTYLLHISDGGRRSVQRIQVR
jgi:hypothetical protein